MQHPLLLLLLACLPLLACKAQRIPPHYDANAPLARETTIAVVCGNPIRYAAVTGQSKMFDSLNMSPADRQRARLAFESQMLRTEIQRLTVEDLCGQRGIKVGATEVETQVHRYMKMRSGLNKTERDQLEESQRGKVLNQLRIRKLIESLEKSHEIKDSQDYVNWLYQQMKTRTSFLHQQFQNCLAPPPMDAKEPSH